MRTLVDKLIEFERQVALERGSFVLLGMFRLAEGSGNWDIVVSARWPNLESISTVEYLAEKLLPLLTREEALSIRGIFPLSPDQPFVQQTTERFRTEAPHGVKTAVRPLANINIAGLEISEAYIVIACDDVMQKSSAPLFESDDMGWE